MAYVDQWYQEETGGLHWLSAQDQDNAAQPGWSGPALPDPSWTAITAAQAQAILDPTPTAEQLLAYANAKAEALIATPIAVSSGATTLKSDAGSDTLADWLALQQWASANASATTQWIADDCTVTALPASAVNELANLVGTRAQAIWQALADVLVAIGAGTITTTAEIDAASWSVSS